MVLENLPSKKSLPWRRFGYVIIIIKKFGELLLGISPRITNTLRSYTKHSSENFIRYLNTLKLVKKNSAVPRFFNPQLSCYYYYYYYSYLLLSSKQVEKRNLVPDSKATTSTKRRMSTEFCQQKLSAFKCWEIPGNVSRPNLKRVPIFSIFPA